MTQKCTSANTSVNATKIPTVFRQLLVHLGTQQLTGFSRFLVCNHALTNKNVDNIVRYCCEGEINSLNLDYGGGKFDNVTDYLKAYGVENLVYDPFNRSEEHNKAVLDRVVNYGECPDTVTCANVLNVIDDDQAMIDVIAKCAAYVKGTGTVYFQIYEGNKSGIGKVSKKDCYQRNARTESYIPHVKKYFEKCSRHGNIIVAWKPRSQEDM